MPAHHLKQVPTRDAQQTRCLTLAEPSLPQQIKHKRLAGLRRGLLR